MESLEDARALLKFFASHDEKHSVCLARMRVDDAGRDGRGAGIALMDECGDLASGCQVEGYLQPVQTCVRRLQPSC